MLTFRKGKGFIKLWSTHLLLRLLTYTLHAVAWLKLKLGTAYPYEGFLLIITATYGMSRSRNCGLQKTSRGELAISEGSPPETCLAETLGQLPAESRLRPLS